MRDSLLTIIRFVGYVNLCIFEVKKETMRKEFGSIVKLCVVVLFAMSLCFVVSCKKSPQGQPEAPNAPVETKVEAPVQKTEEKPAPKTDAGGSS